MILIAGFSVPAVATIQEGIQITQAAQMAKDMSAATQRGIDLGLNDDEIVIYDALAVNESAVKAMDNDELSVIAAELVPRVRKSITINWTVRGSA